MPPVANVFSPQHGNKLICKDQAKRVFKPTMTMYLLIEQDSSNFSPNFFWWHLRSLFPSRLYYIWVTCRIQPHFITPNSPSTRRLFLVDRSQRSIVCDHRHSNGQYTLCISKSLCKWCNFPRPSLAGLPRIKQPNKVLQSQDNMFCIFLLPLASDEKNTGREAINRSLILVKV